MTQLAYGILGPLEVWRDDTPLRLGRRSERALLTLLAASPNQVVSSDRLAEDLWAGDPPPTAPTALRVYVSRLRKTLEPDGDALVTQPPGYLLRADDDAVDARRFEMLAARGHERAAGGDHTGAAEALGQALSLWRGPALAEVADAPLARAEAARLEELRLATTEDRIDAVLACGAHRAVIGELEALTQIHPLRERLWALRMLALYRDGRQAEALRVYHDLRCHLRDHLGLEPAEPMHELEVAILRHDPALLSTVGPALAVGQQRTGLGRLQPVPLPGALARPGSFRFVGRQAEAEVLSWLGQEAAGGERRAVLVAGEAGVGKTRLVAEAAARFHRQGAVVLFGRCEEELGVPYQPFAEALAEYVAAASTEDLAGQLGPLGGELSRLLPGLPARVGGLAPPLQTESGTERYRLFEAVREFFVALSKTAPVVVVLEDLHWAAPPTLALLLHLVRRTERARLLIVGTYRDTELGRTHPLAGVLADLRRLAGTDRIALTGLDEAAVVAFVEALANHPVEGDLLALTQAVWSETDGNPFFVGEVLRHLVESGATAEVDGRWRVIRPLGEVGIPEGVREVVGRRLSRLPPAVNDVLTTAAVIGREFELSVLTEVAPRGVDAALDAIERAEAARLVAPRPGRPGVYAFAHALVRSTLYEELPTTTRLRLHRRIGLALEGRGGTALPELAHHFVEAAPLGVVARAVKYARQAGDGARQGLAFEEAASHYERALAALDLGDDAGLRGAGPSQRCDLQIALGDALNHTRDRRYREVLAAAAESARRLGDRRRLAEVAVAHNLGFARPVGRTDDAVVALAEEALAGLPPGDDPLRARLLAVVGLELAWSLDADRRRELLRQATAMAHRIGDRRVLTKVLVLRRWADTDPDQLPSRMSGAHELIALAEELGDAEAAAIGYAWLAMGHYEDGDVAGSLAALEAAQDYAGQLRNPVLEAELTEGRTIIALLLGRLDDARRLMHIARDLATEVGMPQRTVVGHFVGQSVLLHYELGESEQSLESLELMDPYFAESGTAEWGWRAIRGLACMEAGDEATARRLLTELNDAGPSTFARNATWLATLGLTGRLAAALDDRDMAARLHALLLPYAGRACWIGPAVYGPVDPVLGLLAATLHRWDEAEAHFAQGVELCQRRGTPTWLARTRYEWARMLFARSAPGDAGRARQLAAEALAGAKQLRMAAVAARSEALLTRG